MYQVSVRSLVGALPVGRGQGVRGPLPATRTRGRPLRLAAILLLALTPTLLAAAYYGLIASKRYVSESRFVVRSAARPNIGIGLTSLLQMTGLARAQDDIFAVQDFIGSRAALAGMPTSVDLRRIYGPAGADFLAGYPSILYGSSDEELHRFMRWMIGIRYDPNTAITTLKVQAFSPEDARLVSRTLLDVGEQVVNRINERIRSDAIRLADEEVKRAEQRVLAAQLEITDFRNREMMIDPARNSMLVIDLVGRLSSDLAQTRALIIEMTSATPDNPQIAALQRKAAALQQQIATERARVTTQSDGLADKLAAYEKLTIEKEFAARLLAAALTTLESARTEARRQQLYLQRIVEPSLPDHPMEPTRLFNVMTVFAGNVLLLLIGWLIATGIRSHAFH